MDVANFIIGEKDVLTAELVHPQELMSGLLSQVPTATAAASVQEYGAVHDALTRVAHSPSCAYACAVHCHALLHSQCQSRLSALSMTIDLDQELLIH